MLLIGYLVVFISVPIMEVAFMRHTTVTSKEVSQVLKLVGFQILATLSTIGSFVGDTNGALNRDWCATQPLQPHAPRPASNLGATPPTPTPTAGRAQPRITGGLVPNPNPDPDPDH